MLDVHRLMTSLSDRRPIFHSEADFQHEFAWEIRSARPYSKVRLEYPIGPETQKAVHLDIWLPIEQVAIELKYYTRKFAADWHDEVFLLRNHGAHPPKRYDFVNDIQRLEQSKCKNGFAILLTNDPLYWQAPPRSGTIDAAFRVHESKELTGRLNWRGSPAAGTIRDRESNISLSGVYKMRWRDYWEFSAQRFGQFRYLTVSVGF